MARDPYQILGVAKDASDADIRKAYRKLAKENHPDLHPGDKAAEERFKEVQSAYNIVGDKDRRAQFDRGEIDAEGNERAQQSYYYRDYADAGAGHPYHSTGGYSDFADIGDVFEDLFGHARAGQGRAARRRGGDVRYTFSVEFLDAAKGAKRRITMPDGKSLDLSIPAGVRDGQILRLKGKGTPGLGGGEAGDALVEVHVKPHKLFRREGDDVHIELPIALNEAVLGAKVRVPTIDGLVTMTIPANSNSGDRLRLRGKGIPAGNQGKRGDQYVTLSLVLPEKVDEELRAFVESWAQDHPYDPRKEIEV